MPVCARCIRRGVSASCFYHPAPLARSRLPSVSHDIDQGQSIGVTLTRSVGPSSTSPLASPGGHVADSNTRDHITDCQAQNADIDHREHPASSVPIRSSAVTLNSESAALARQIATCLDTFKETDLLIRLLDEYFAVSQAALVPRCLILPAVKTLANVLSVGQASDNDHSESMLQLGADILDTTSRRLLVDAPISSDEYSRFYTEAPLRLEVLGIIATIAARSCLLGLARDEFSREEYVRAMFQCSSNCLLIARNVSPTTTDMMVWLEYENILLSISLQGDTGMSHFLISSSNIALDRYLRDLLALMLTEMSQIL
jgi:hypothetical protein